MPYQTEIVNHLRRWGLIVTEEPGWQTRGNIGFAPKGIVCHHTAINSDSASIRVVRDGRADLPGPLSQFVLLKDGTVHVVAAGRSNHAGTGGWKGLQGNSSVWGIEAVNGGTVNHPWPPTQLDAWYRLCAALMDFSGFSSEYVCAHREWTNRKIDPHTLNMDRFRNTVRAVKPPSTTAERQYMPAINISVVSSVKLADGRVYLAQADGSLFGFEVQPIRGANGMAYFVGREVARLWRNDAPEVPAYARGAGDGLGISIQTTSNEWYGDFR